MTETQADPFAGPIHRAQFALSETIPLYVHLVKGSNYAVWIDSGVKSMFPLLQETMAAGGVSPSQLKFVLHTHSHHDHIGCNAQLKALTGCLLAADPFYKAWHADFERHYQEFARPFPHLIADTPALREEVLSVLDAPVPLDLWIGEGVRFDLGGGVSLQAFSLPGHMLAELGWFEASTRTLILGDAITGLDWPLFHSHLTVDGYRRTIQRIRSLLVELDIAHVLMAHFAPMTAAEMRVVLGQADRYLAEIEATMLGILGAESAVSLETLWVQTCTEMDRSIEFRALNMVAAHVQDLLERGVIEQVGVERYAYKGG
jgi:glyoxylase-like metal-dependent hydrolase (beta-lactamase superfamily II)